jgi:hypothetical protein
MVRYLCYQCLHEWETENFIEICDNCGEMGFMLPEKSRYSKLLGSTEDEQHSK